MPLILTNTNKKKIRRIVVEVFVICPPLKPLLLSRFVIKPVVGAVVVGALVIFGADAVVVGADAVVVGADAVVVGANNAVYIYLFCHSSSAT